MECCKFCDSKFCKFIGYGGVIWGVAFLVASIFIGFKVESEVLMHSVTTLAAVITAFLLAKGLNLSKRGEMLKYSLSWVIVVFILEVLIDTKFAPDIPYSPYIWLGFFLILVVPLLAVKPEGK